MLQAIARMLGWVPASAPSGTDITAAPPPGLQLARGGDADMPQPLDATALRLRNRERAIARTVRPPPR